MRARGVSVLALVLLTTAAAAALAAQGAREPEALAAAKRGAAPACTRYAAPRGSDSSPGTRARPFRTAQRLADALRPGQTGCLRGGTYSEDGEEYVLSPRHGGRSGAPITIRSHPGERAKLVGIVYVPRGSDHVTISHLTLEGNGDSSTVKVTAADVRIAYNDITNAWRGVNCIILGNNDGWGAAVRPVVRSNRIHECGNLDNASLEHGLYASNVQGGRIVGNRFWNVAGYAMQIYPNAQGVYIAHNVVDGGDPSVRGGVVVGGDDEYASSGNVIEHNVVAYARTYNIVSNWEDSVGHGNVVRANCLWRGLRGNFFSEGGVTGSGNKVANPGFVDRARRDYRLRPGSPCRALLK